MFRSLLQSTVQRLPSQCAICHTWPAQPLCHTCVNAFARPTHRCQLCALPLSSNQSRCGLCLRAPPVLDQCLAAVSYDYPWSGLIAEFKFREHVGWSASFAMLMRSAPWVEPTLEAAQLVIPMPLSLARLRQRGFNPSALLARALEPAKTSTDILLRTQDRPAQSSLPRSERQRNVKGVYAVDPLRASALAGKRVVLLDDVMTTGASLYEAAKVLRLAGALHICALVLARTQ